ncbi:MAG: hypothetical protein ACOYJX_01020 [Acutalibacteraceae bacterium]
MSFFAAGVLSVLPVRVYQYLYVVEPKTGFYTGSDLSINLLYILLGVFCAAPLILAFFGRYSTRYSTTVRKQPVLGVLAFGVTAGLALDAIAMTRYYGNIKQAVLSPDSSPLTQVLTNDMLSASRLPVLAQIVFAFLALAFFSIYGVSLITGKFSPERFKILALSPLGWAVCRILHRFMRTISFLRVSDLFFELLMLVALMLFFMAFAQVVSRVNNKDADWKIIGFGLPAALLCLLCFVPRMAMVILGKGSVLAMLSPPEYCDLALGIFIPALILGKMRFLKGKRRED